MSLLAGFFSNERTSLKVCGVTRADDAGMLVELGVDAIGVNFWPQSKRYLPPAEASWLSGLGERILRVGVFVNADPELPLRLVREGWIDVVQLHGDERPLDARPYQEAGIPFIKALGVKGAEDLADVECYAATAILLDAHAPGVYGGTGRTMDWGVAVDFSRNHPDLPLILAGGIVPENAGQAAALVRPAALDTASGVESAPGIKDRSKIEAMLSAIRAHAH